MIFRRPQSKPPSDRGQSIVETAMALPLLIMIVLALIEMGIIFASYVALVNAAREGAYYAMNHPELAYSSCGKTPPPTCSGPDDNDPSTGTPYSGTRSIWTEYETRVSDEVLTSVAERLKGGDLITLQEDQDFVVMRPVISSSCKTEGCPITVTVQFKIQTFTSSMSLPGVGRFGLPNYYQLNYSYEVAIHGDYLGQ